ncbi:PAS domain S-box protein [Desulfobaculum bizertense]|uniref:histidine kinase n=1 Tax=Desulfobaculum bizertense DSM 18034 TaxID=1121442 RepID=A0A1T4VCY7_9BACT|nr:PAS domain S-box protein [Desulfobaculum bizertense]UIJ37573.1 PAS domain S-box protein [Desulfobaculum bizertense]SKA62738.1 PAS domain S-box-containing protein [Desulfobaculum bizertense DSM 18034]
MQDQLEFYSKGLEDFQDCGVVFRRDGTLLFANEAYLKKRGMSKEDALGRNIFDLIDPMEEETLRGAVLQAVDSTHMCEIVLRMRTLDGSGVRQFRWQGMEILTPEGQENLIVAQGRPLHPLGEDDDSVMGFTISTNGNILDVSEDICTMCGYTREEVLNVNTSQLYYTPEERRTIRNLLRRGGIERGQVTLRCKDGSPMNFLFTVQPVRDAKGHIRSFSGYFIPSGFPHAARLVKDFTPVVNALPDIAWAQGRDHRLVAVNDAYCDAFGLSRDKVLGHLEADFLPPEQAQLLVQAAINVFQERREIITPMAPHFNGQERWYRIVRRPVFDDANREVIGLVGICRDITSAVKQETEYMRSLGEESFDALIVIDGEGRIIRRASKVLDPPVLGDEAGVGRVAGDLTQIVDILHSDDLELAQEAMRKVMTRKKPLSFECRVRNRSRRYTRVFIRAHYNDRFFDEPRMYVNVRDLSHAESLRSAESVLSRLREATSSETWKELAAFLNVSSASVSNARKNNRIPPDWLITVGARTDTSIDWLLTGLGPQHRKHVVMEE